MITYVISQFRYRLGRALAVMAGVALGVALFVALVALGNGFREAARAPLAGVAADLLITRPAGAEEASSQRTRGPRLPFGSTLLSAGEVAAVSGTDGVGQVADALEVWDFGANSYQVVLGIDTNEDQVGPAQALREGLLNGRLLQAGDSGVAVADRHYAAFYSLKPGGQVTIGGREFQIVGVAEQKGSSQAGVANLYVTLADAQALVGLGDGQVNRVYARLASASKVESIVQALTARLGSLSIVSQESILQVMGGVARVSTRFAGIAAAVGMVAGWVLAWLALSGLVAERRREIGVMKAVGWRSRDVRRAFLGESFLLSVAGALAGMVLGLGAALGLSGLPAPTGSGSEVLPGLAVALGREGVARLPAQVAPGTLALALVIAVSGGVLAGWISARRAADIKPARALRDY